MLLRRYLVVGKDMDNPVPIRRLAYQCCDLLSEVPAAKAAFEGEGRSCYVLDLQAGAPQATPAPSPFRPLNNRLAASVETPRADAGFRLPGTLRYIVFFRYPSRSGSLPDEAGVVCTYATMAEALDAAGNAEATTGDVPAIYDQGSGTQVAALQQGDAWVGRYLFLAWKSSALTWQTSDTEYLTTGQQLVDAGHAVSVLDTFRGVLVWARTPGQPATAPETPVVTEGQPAEEPEEPA